MKSHDKPKRFKSSRNQSLIVAMMSISALVGACWTWSPIQVSRDLCGRCYTFEKEWLEHDTSELVTKYGQPTSRFPLDEKAYTATKFPNHWIEGWHYDKPELDFEVRYTDHKVTRAQKVDHRHLLDP